MRFHYDWEFKEDGITIKPISMGMVDDNGRELYMIYRPEVREFHEREYFNKLDQTDLWLKDNVFNYISESDLDKYGFDTKHAMAQKVWDFICDGLVRGNNNVELWGYYAAYDHVCLSQLFGRMIDLPPPMPMFTNDLMTLGKNPGGFKIKPPRPKNLPEHHSLMDAKYQKLIFDEWSS